ncbi:GntR family transcriptional regulator [Vallitalea maricola]|uniref:GntR family transcriptional regulator n=1 Tax=Vallitalea maricola TaxID=3074433 RepID=A0ACB5UHR0_9FIRM|nr:GntR family transcriptional regulator [Vallitalea sp. AN17-2]
MINVEISNTSEKPIYQQLFEQISSQIIKGDLKSNYGLPPIRTAAKELRISIITVKKAWEALERQGFIYTITGRGCFVAELTAEDIKNKKDELTHKQMAKDIQYYKELGLSLSEVTELVKKHY